MKNLSTPAFIFSLLFFLFTHRVQAIEVITVIPNECPAITGFIVNNEDGLITMLTAKGQTASLNSREVNQVVIHSVIDFPFNTSELSPDTPWFDIILLDEDKSHFEGTPIQFVDDLIFFLNKNGKLEVVPLTHIGKIKTLKGTHPVLWQSGRVDFDFSNVRSNCPQLPTGHIPPTRILNDPVQIEEFFNNFEKGYDKFRHLSERMNFYAKPLLYNRTTRLGFVSVQKNPETTDLSLFNFKFSSGEPFGLQSSTELMSFQSDWIPFYFPTNSVSFMVKSHLFHALFIGHIASLTGGRTYFEQGSPGDTYEFKEAPFYLSHSYNYLTEFGFDYRHFSFSFGGYYPIEYSRTNDGTYREILASSMQPALILTYTREDWRLRFSGSTYRLSHSSDGDNPSLEGKNNAKSLVGISGQSSGHFYRLGFDWNLPNAISIKLDALEHSWKYDENLTYNAIAQERTLGFSIAKDFGRYVSLRAYVARIDYDWSLLQNSTPFNLNTQETLMGGEFEFIF